jgi:hypothetical protein
MILSVPEMWPEESTSEKYKVAKSALVSLGRFNQCSKISTRSFEGILL